MRFIAISDLHAHDWQDCSDILPSGRNSRLEDLLNALSHVREYCRIRKIKHVFVLGDVFHARGVIKVDVFSSMFSFFSDWSKAVSLVFLVGNHDWNFDLKSHALLPFSEFALVVDKPRTCAIGEQGIAFAFPYMNDRKELVGQLSDAKHYKHYPVVLLHQGISGVPARSGYYVGELIGKSDLPKNKMVLSGHYHEHQQIQKNAWYVGSLLQQNWGDVGIDKYFLDVDTDRKSVTPVPSVGPKFVELNVRDKGYVTPNVKALVRGNFVRAVMSRSKDLLVEQVCEQLRQMKARYVSVHLDGVTSTDRVPLKNLDVEKLVKEYVHNCDIDLDKDSLIKKGNEVLEEVTRRNTQ